MKRWGKISALLSLVFCVCFSLGGGARAEETGESLKVLVPLMNNSGFVTYESREFSGYYIDYLMEIAKYTGWDYEFTAIENYDELNRACESGDFDLMTGIVYSEEYDNEYFDYPNYAVGAKHYVFAVPKDSELIQNKEYSYLRGARIGIAPNSGVAQDSGIGELEVRFKNFCYMYGINCVSDEKEYPNGVDFIHIGPSAWREKLASGEIDGILSSDAFCLEQGMYAITTFGLDQIYFVSPNGRDGVLETLNETMEKITSFDPEYNERLYSEYFSENTEHAISFNGAENAFLENEHVWKVGMPENYAPYSYINDSGEPAGMITEVMNRITESTQGKLRFEYQFYGSLKEAFDAVKAGECDISGITMYSLLQKRNSGERRSRSFYTDSFMYYKNTGEMAGSGTRAAVVPELPAILMSDIDLKGGNIAQALPAECLRRVEEGKADFTVMLSHVGDYYKSYYGFTNPIGYLVPEADVMFCFSYSPEMEPAGIAVIDKCLLGIERGELSAYVTGLSLFEHKSQTMRDYIKNHFYFFTFLLVGILLTICILLVVVMIYVTNNSRKIYNLLYKDEITGGISYRKFMEEAKENVQKPGKKLMMYINISSFKYINDVFGYGRGNEVLQEVADFLESCMEGDIFARSYADRFVALVSYENEDQLRERIRESLEEFEEVCRKKFPSFNIWIKVGAYVIKEGDDIQKSVNLANYAVDEIQKTSRSDYVFYDETMYNRVLIQKEIEKDMRGAMENGEFEAFYQPKYHIDTKKLVGAEALVRWRHPEKGLLSPGLFIPIFEKNHFILQVDFYIFECVCRFHREMMTEGVPLFPISSNFSRLHLNQSDFVEHLVRVAKKYQVPPKYLEIEITETVAMEDFDQLIATVKELKKNDFQVSIDDFGSGYSSVQLLYKLPIDVLKFDKAFVDNETPSKIEAELVNSIISVSHRNGIRIICEGVETPKQEEYVREHHCVYVQGFLYSRPMPEDDFRKLVKEDRGSGKEI